MAYRVLQVINRNNLGGLLLIAYNIAEGLQDRYEIEVVSGMRSDDEGDATHLTDQYKMQLQVIPEMQRSVHPLRDLKAYLHLKKIIQKFQPHIVHTHAAKAGALGRLAARSCGVPVILHQFHGHVFHNFFNPIASKIFVTTEKYLTTKCDAIITISDEVKNDLVEKYKITTSDKAHVIPIGVDFRKFLVDKIQNRNKFRGYYSINENDVVIGIIGRVVSSKNVSAFVNIVRNAAEKTQHIIKAFIIGDGDDMPNVMQTILANGYSYNSTSTAYIANGNSVPSNLSFYLTSWLQDIASVQAAMDIVSLTSLNDGTPVSLMEAQASEVPVVAYDAGGARATFVHNRSGFLIPQGDENLFVKKLLMLIENKNLRSEMGEEGKKYVLKKYSLETMNDQIDLLYKKLLQDKNIKE